MKCPAVNTIDFETKPIAGYRPDYPPVPVGVSIKLKGKKSHYYAWGHPEGNNCTKADAQRALKAAWEGDLLFHNAKFDYDVALTHMGAKPKPAEQLHDTVILAFLRDPHSRNLQLKPLAERYLNMPPEERDAVEDWVKANKAYCLEQHYMKPFKPGAYVAYAPVSIAGPYAKGDTDRTEGLFKDCWDEVINVHDMLASYRREQQVMPIFLDNERVGIRIALDQLRADVTMYRRFLQAADDWLRKRLKQKDLNIDSDADFAEALARNKIVRDEDWTWTKGGKNVAPQRSVSKVNLPPHLFKDQQVARAFGYRNRLATCLKMFMEPWLAQGEARGGWISTNWNLVRGEGGGTRTGRPSTSDPNFLNISKTWDNNDDGYAHPDHMGVDPLPLVRRYLLPDKDGLWLHRDYNGQELRLLAHFEDGPLMEAYRENPWLDVHQHVANLIEEKTGKTFTRKNVKIANFRIIYGGGAPATALGIGCSLAEAKDLLAAHGAALPSIKGRGGLTEEIKAMSKRGDPIITWGGRVYFVEPPSFSKKHGRMMEYDYKLLNYECQGSAADVTKQSIINYHNHPKRRGRFLVSVYDENNVSSPGAKSEKARMAAAKEEMAVLRESMEMISDQLDVPMLSEGKIGTSWGDQVKFEEGPSAYV